MRVFHRINFLLALLFLIPQAAFAQETDPSPEVLLIREEQSKYPLGPSMEILRDSSGDLTIQEVTSDAYHEQWFTSQENAPNFGYQVIPYWVRFRVQNLTGRSGQWFLVLGFNNMHYMDLYIPHLDGQGYTVRQGGVLRSQPSQSIKFEEPYFELEIPPDTEQTFYIRFQSEATMTLPLTLYAPEAFSRYVLYNQLSYGAFYGIFLIMLVYNAILWVMIRDKTYLFLVLFSIFTIGFFLFYDAVIYLFHPNMVANWATILTAVLLGGFILTFILFVDSFLDFKQNQPKAHATAMVVVTICLGTSIAAFFIQYQAVIIIQLIIGILCFTAMLIMNIYLVWHGNRHARYLLISWIGFYFGAVFGALVRLRLWPSNILSEQFIRIGLVWMIALWSLALADRLNSLKQEAETSKRIIKEEERNLAQYLDSMPVGVMVFDSNFQPRYVNKQSQKILNQAGSNGKLEPIPHESIGETIAPFNEDSSHNHVMSFPIEQIPINSDIQEGRPAYIDHIDIDRGNEKIPVEFWSNPLVGESGDIIGTIIAFQNIHERLVQQDLLRRSEEFRKNILAGSSIGTWMLDLSSGDVTWDKRTREIFGVEPDETATLELGFGLIHPEDRQAAKQAYELAIAPESNGTYVVESRILQPNGQERWISTRGNVIYEELSGESQAVRMVGIIVDVTVQKLAEKELEESRIQYQNLIETMKEGLAIVDENLVLVYVNPRLSEMLGYTPEEMIGKSVGNFFDQENFSIIKSQFEGRKTGEDEPYTVTLRRRDGSALHSMISPAPVFEESGKFLHSIAVVSDISEQIKANQLLDQRMQERTLEIASLMKVSRTLVSPLGFEDQIMTILENLGEVIPYSSASVILQKENRLITSRSHTDLAEEITMALFQPFMQPDLINQQYWHGETLLIPNIWELPATERHFFNLLRPETELHSTDKLSCIRIPIKGRRTLIGLLTAHADQKNFFTPQIAELMQAYANQMAIIFENNRLYKQAQSAAAASERDRLARELHDSVTQSLYSVRLYAEAVRSALISGKQQTAEKHLEQLMAIARDGLGNLRLLIFELRPPALEELGLVGALQKRLEMVENRAGIHAKLITSGTPDLTRERETQLYWVIYEALSNVLKHAHAKHVSLKFDFSNGNAHVILQDDGVGFDLSIVDISQSSGLKNIVDRIQSAGGDIQVSSKPGKGTTLKIFI